jgi:two-component system OmpR family sensor kinase
LTGAVAHEFRTPLARLKFALESLPQGSKKNSMSEDLAELDALIREMLEFSESVHHQPELSIAEIAVAELVAKLIDRLPSSLRQGIDIHNRCENVILQADGHFVERAVLNLITNSLKYAESKIDIRTVQQQGALLIVVEDDGSGVPESLRDKVFDPFYRPDKSRTRHQGGAGLGLATVKRIQQWHQGDCWVEKSTMGGAKFILSYPHINMADK